MNYEKPIEFSRKERFNSAIDHSTWLKVLKERGLLGKKVTIHTHRPDNRRNENLSRDTKRDRGV